MPMIHFKPIDNKAENNVEKDEDIIIYKAPLYKAANREGKLSTTGQSTNYVIDVHIPSPKEKSASHWTHRAAALVCMLSD
jgi:dynein heavy chain